MALRVQIVSGNNTLYYLHTDHLGSTSLATTTGGAVVAGSTARYYPFGDWRTEPTASDPNGSPLTDRGFTGHLHNNIGSGADDIGLVYMNARWYLPSLGRFISADSIIPNPANPQSYNRYSYVLNRALNFTDPTGHRECGAHDGCSGEALPSLPLPPAPAPSQPSTPQLPAPVFEGLPVAAEQITRANGFGANSFAAYRADPDSAGYDGTYRNSGGLHPGLDFLAIDGTSVYSNVHGVIQMPSPYPGDAGNPVIDGNASNVVVLLDNGMYVIFDHVVGIEGLTNGMEIQPGQLIGTVADQGDNSHVHLALRQSVSEGERVYNPANYFSDSSILDALPWSGYTEGENLHSISSFLYQPSNNRKNFWVDGPLAVGVTR